MCLQVIDANVTPKSLLNSARRCYPWMIQGVGIVLRHWSESGVGMLCQRRVQRDVISEGSPLSWIMKRKRKSWVCRGVVARVY